MEDIFEFSEELDFEQDMDVDLSNLEVEWVQQPRMAFTYGRYYSSLERKLALSEEDLELYSAQLTDYVNSNVEETLGKGVKTTVANVQSYLLQQKEYQEKKTNIINLRHKVRIAKIAYDQISNARKNALENAVKLLQQNYFAGPAMPHEIEIKEKRTMRNDASIAEKMKRKVKTN